VGRETLDWLQQSTDVVAAEFVEFVEARAFEPQP
tara:strand:- start:363 stop:464 length:102 start_codon:yes stop_codon:yes gene_type:complete